MKIKLSIKGIRYFHQIDKEDLSAESPEYSNKVQEEYDFLKIVFDNESPIEAGEALDKLDEDYGQIGRTRPIIKRLFEQDLLEYSK